MLFYKNNYNQKKIILEIRMYKNSRSNYMLNLITIGFIIKYMLKYNR